MKSDSLPVFRYVERVDAGYLSLGAILLVIALIVIRVGVAIGSRLGRRENRKSPTHKPASVAAVSPQVGDSAVRRAASPEPRAAASVGGVGISISFGEPERVERPVRQRKEKLTWRAPSQPITHAGLAIGSGMIYVAERSLAWPGEPSAIITGLRVAPSAAHPLQDFGY